MGTRGGLRAASAMLAVAVLATPAAAGPVAAAPLPAGDRVALPAPPVASPGPDGASGPQAVIVKFRSRATPAARTRSRGRAGVQRLRPLSSIGAEVVRPEPGQSVARAVARLAADPDVEFAEPDWPIVEAADPAQEPLLHDDQWGLDNDGISCAGDVPCRRGVDIDAPSAWTLSTGSGVTVAVLDDGVDFTNGELATQAWTNPGESGLDAQGADKATNGIDDDGNGFIDDVHGVNLCPDAPAQALHVTGADWHGTAVASVLAAAANGIGMVGVAPDARVMAVRWLEPACATVSYAVESIDYAIANGADVINASWGTTEASAALRAAVRRADDAGILIVAAAGNLGTTLPFYPAAFDAPNVVSVAALQADGRLADYSSFGPSVDLAAPGSAILAVDVIHDTLALFEGTSFAAPHVAGIAALVGQVRPDLLANPAALRARLINSGWRNFRTAYPLTASGRVADARNALDFTAPTAPAWIRGVGSNGTTLGAAAVWMRLSWDAAADDLAINSYRVRYRRVGTTSWTTLAGDTRALDLAGKLKLGTTYEIQVTVRDAGGNTTSAALTLRAVRRQETRAEYHGSWRRTVWSSASGGHTRYATRAGSWASFSFTGRSAALVMPKGRSMGKAKIYVDGVYARTINLHASSTHARRIVFSWTWSRWGAHTIRIVALGTARHPRIDVDALVIGR